PDPAAAVRGPGRVPDGGGRGERPGLPRGGCLMAVRYPLDLRAETIEMPVGDSERIAAYLAQPLVDERVPGVVVIHHMPGWDEGTKEIVRRFASHGYAAICPHLYHRAGADLSPDDAAAAGRAAGGVGDPELLRDVGAGIEHLRGLPSASGKVGVIGYCSGGRPTLLTAGNLDGGAAGGRCGGVRGAGGPPRGGPPG